MIARTAGAAATGLLACCATFGTFAAFASRGAEPLHTLQPDDLYRAVAVSAPEVSPEGAWVAYVVTTNDRAADEPRSAIWMASWDGRQRLAMTEPAKDTDKPHWSPDGRYLAYVATQPGSDKLQVMVLDRRGGGAHRLTEVAGDIRDYAWSPDGARLVLVADELAPAQGASAGAAPKPLVIDAMHFKTDADGYYTAGSARHLYLFDLAAARLEALTDDAAFNEEFPAWSPDGRQIAFVRTHERGGDPDGRFDLAVVAAQPHAAVRTLVRDYAPNSQRLAWSPDGTGIVYLQGLEPKFNAYMQDRLAMVPAQAPGDLPARALTAALDRAVTSFAFSAPGMLELTIEDDGTIYPARLDVRSGKLTRELPGAPPAVVTDLSSHAGHTAGLLATDAALAEVVAVERGRTRRLSAHNEAWLGGLTLGAVEDVRFSSQGVEVHGLMVKPPGFVAGRRYPLMLWIHGGPNGGDEHALALDAYQFEHQMFAAKGYVVLRVNYRGGSGRGAAYAQAILADWGHKEVQDLLAGVDYAVARGIADPDRLAIGGWSYGAILTDYTIATDGRFKAAIAGAGSANQLTTYGSDQYVLQYNAELGAPWQNTALWLQVSYPFFHADRIHTPTLFLGGEKDFNVPIAGGEQMYQSLRTLGVPTQLVIYPEQHHVFTRPSYIKDLAERMSGWLDRYVSPAR